MLPPFFRFFAVISLILLSGISACSSPRSGSPAPVTTLELRENFYNERNRGSLTAERYIVQKGDTLYSIAFRAGMDIRILAQHNGINSPYTIYPGQVIRLTAATTAQTRAATAPVPSRANTAAKPATTATSPARVTTPAPATASSGSTRTTSNNASKSVASKNQTGYVQKSEAESEKSVTTSGNKVQWQWPVRGHLISGFSHQQHGNKGLDIAGREGNRINAAADGQIVYAGNALRGYGNLIIIKHNDDYLSAYAHNKKILVKEKQHVRAGQQIAEMGSTDATDSRLHFEIRFRGTSVDPLKYLPK